MNTDYPKRDIEKPKPTKGHTLYVNTEHQPALHVFREEGKWKVWLNPTSTPTQGLCIGIGPDLTKALGEASALLTNLADVLDHYIIHGQQWPLGEMCRCGHHTDAHGSDGAGHCGATEKCRSAAHGCKAFTPTT